MAILQDLRELIQSPAFKNEYRQSARDFTRDRILSFVSMVVCQITSMSKSLSVEISRFVEKFVDQAQDCSKQAFSQRRSKLKAAAFVALNDQLIKQYYQDEYLLRLEGYIPVAIDGTLLQLPESKPIIEQFGLAENKGKSMPMSRSSVVYDVENKLILQALAQEYTASEQSMALTHLAYLKQVASCFPFLVLFDRGYPSLYLLAYLESIGMAYVMRCNARFIAEVAQFAASGQTDTVLAVDLTTKSRQTNKNVQSLVAQVGTCLQVRVVKILLPTTVEYLLTSLADTQKFTLPILAALYHKRWGVETNYDWQKNDLQLENFSAKTVEGIKQDYQAKILAANLATLLIADVETEWQTEQQQQEPTKHTYQINRAVALGLVKDKLPDLLWSKHALEAIYDQLRAKIKRRKVAVIPNRSFPRKRKLHYKFPLNNRLVF